MKELSSPPRGLLRGAHAAGLLFIVLPILDVALNVWPFRLDVNWRYGTTGLLSNYLLTPLLGLLVIGLAAAVGRQRRILLVTAWGSLLAGVLVLAGVAIFGLDALELNSTIPPAGKYLFRVGAAKATVKLLLMGMWMIGFGWAASREARSRRTVNGKDEEAGLIIRRQPAGKGG